MPTYAGGHSDIGPLEQRSCEAWVQVPLGDGTIPLLILTHNNHNNSSSLQTSFQSCFQTIHATQTPSKVMYVLCIRSYTHVKNKQKIKKSSIGRLIYKNFLPYTEGREQDEIYSNTLKKSQLSVYVCVCVWISWLKLEGRRDAVFVKCNTQLLCVQDSVSVHYIKQLFPEETRFLLILSVLASHRTLNRCFEFVSKLEELCTTFVLLFSVGSQHLIVVSNLSPSSRSCVKLLCCCLQRGVDTLCIVYFK